MKKKARNTAKASNSAALGEKEAEMAREDQPLRYHEGLSKAGNKSLEEPGVIDLGGKTPYGGKEKGWAANSGKLGDLDPQESDQPGWVNTWSPLNTGIGGVGVTIDENYGVQRPRTFTRQKERFAAMNPEFQDVADEGDWTSARWGPV